MRSASIHQAMDTEHNRITCVLRKTRDSETMSEDVWEGRMLEVGREAIKPALGSISILILHNVIRASIDNASIPSPQNSAT